MIARLALILGLLVYLGLVVFVWLGSTRVLGEPSGPVIVSSISQAPTVSVVYFYPNDQIPTADYPLDAIMSDVKGWYTDQVGSTINFQTARFVRGNRDTAYYLQDIWGGVLRELGYYCYTGVHLVVVHPSIGFTGGTACSDLEGPAMVEEDIFAGQEMRPFNGVVAHELGHALSLPHSDCASVMGCWWDYPDVGLTAGEVVVLQNHRYFGAVDTDPECEIRFNPRGKRIGKCKGDR